MDKVYYLQPNVISYYLYIRDLTKEQEAYIRQIYKDFERLPEDSDGYQFKIFAHSHQNYYNKDFEKVMDYLSREGFDREGGCDYCG